MKIEKLELKHLTGYLPYKLEAQILDFKCDYVGKEFDTITGVDQWDKSGKLWCAFTKSGAKPSIDRIKPVLRPLSDLTKEIIHEGKNIVPIVELSKIIGLQLDGYGLDNTDSHCEVHTWGDCFGYDIKDRFFYYIQYDEIAYVKNQDKLWHKMYELKFDIYNLIDAGLAIDSTTVGNPYDK